MNTIYFQSAAEAYEKSQDAIRGYLGEIEEGLRFHEEAAATQLGSGIQWAHTGDLTALEASLKDLADRLHRRGEYARVTRVTTYYQKNGQAVRIATPDRD